MREAGFLPNVSLNVVAIKPPADMEAPSSLQDQPMEEVNTTVEEEEEEADTEAVFVKSINSIYIYMTPTH